ncbi:disease resistance protein RPV1 [Trifolium repens]|nr:disease resistance protein RPV1 [Trifolium repens]
MAETVKSYEVFLRFRGEDTRASFISHLYAFLRNTGINAFRDNDSLKRGDHISTSLMRAIEQSQISVIVFSRNYADLRWCLDELVKIMECWKTIRQMVLPVFYGVDPSEVRHQTGEFGIAFQSLLNRISQEEKEDKLLKWRGALREAADLAGFVVLNSRNENEDIKNIVEKVTHSLDKADLFVANNPVGVKEGVLAVLGCGSGFSGRFSVVRLRMLVLVPLPFLFVSVLVVPGVVMGWWWLEERGGEVVVVGGAKELLQDEAVVVMFGCDVVDGMVMRLGVWCGVGQREFWPWFLCPVTPEEARTLGVAEGCSSLLRLAGMWGMGGSGKTTIAKAIYNEIGRNFDGRSFLANVREVWKQTAEQVHLQEQILFDIFKGTTTKIQNIDSGKVILKDRLCHKKVLLILDDVNESEQLDALCGSYKWFESIELFSWHAFKQVSPKKDFAEISGKVVEYSGRLPLALEVLGRYFFGRQATEWKCILAKLKRIPNDKVQNKLKISYDGLDDFQKAVFLDIACFFIGMDRNDVIHILNGCELFPESGIRFLVEKSLVTVDDKNRLGMHDLLRDMGRKIICDTSRNKPEKRSRLWFPEDVLDVLSAQTGTNAVEGLALKLPSGDAECFSTKAFEKMKKLRLLQLAGVKLDGDFEHLSSKLRWLSWNGFPLICIPTNFYQGNLVSIELENSNLELVWKETQRMDKLKILNLSHSHHLTQSPDFSNMPNLEKLVLKDCPLLSEVSPSIGHLDKILLIDLEDCTSLCSLPRSIYKLKSLKTLILSGCLKIEKLEEDVEQMKSLTTLHANGTAITTVPFSIAMDNLKFLNLSHCRRLTHTPDFSYLPNLEKLELKNCPMLYEISPGIVHLKKLLLMNLKDCTSLRSLPRSIYKLKSLETLILSGCLWIYKLDEDIEQMESLTTLLANNTAITRVPFSVVRLKSIGYISMCGFEGFSHDVFPSIIMSWISPTNNIFSHFLTSTVTSSLVPLNEPHSNFDDLPSIFKHLPSLRSLWIECSSELQLSQDAAIILDALYGTYSAELEPTATTSQVSRNSLKSLFIQIVMNCQVANILKEQILQNLTVDESGGCVLPNDSYPNWLSFDCEAIFAPFSPRPDPVRVRELPFSSTNYFAQAILFRADTRAREKLLRAREIGRMQSIFQSFSRAS